jgi:type I restriction-modification system DNA methylase subunit
MNDCNRRANFIWNVNNLSVPSDDQFSHERFDYLLSTPPYDKDWWRGRNTSSTQQPSRLLVSQHLSHGEPRRVPRRRQAGQSAE